MGIDMSINYRAIWYRYRYGMSLSFQNIEYSYKL
jgi:hypothetical protein